jgi:hypothetical protein
MNRTASSLVRLSVATMFAGAALLWSGHFPLDMRSSLVSSAQAIIGRPLTPLSYAGVARRTTRRAIGAGVAAGAVYGGAVYGAPVVVAPSCVQTVDPYGRIYTRCY